MLYIMKRYKEKLLRVRTKYVRILRPEEFLQAVATIEITQANPRISSQIEEPQTHYINFS